MQAHMHSGIDLRYVDTTIHFVHIYIFLCLFLLSLRLCERGLVKTCIPIAMNHRPSHKYHVRNVIRIGLIVGTLCSGACRFRSHGCSAKPPTSLLYYRDHIVCGWCMILHAHPYSMVVVVVVSYRSYYFIIVYLPCGLLLIFNSRVDRTIYFKFQCSSPALYFIYLFFFLVKKKTKFLPN